MASTKETDVPAQAPQDNDFEKRHAQELGVGRFAKIQALYTLVPIVAGAAGAAIGHYVLAKPLAKLLPRINKAAGATEAMGGKIWEGVVKLADGKSAGEAFSGMSLTPEQVETVVVAWKNKDLSHDKKAVAIAEALKLPLPEVAKTVRHISTGGTAAIGAIGGGIAVGYDRWHKEESARLAAQEVNGDVAKIQLFKPSDSELVAENKRLREMVAAIPDAKIEAASMKRQGTQQNKQQNMSIA